VYTWYSYDDTNQLTSANGSGEAAYAYDANGNRTGTNLSTGGDNQLSSDGMWDYVYDAEGNRVEKHGHLFSNVCVPYYSTSEIWTYGYDNANHLVSVERKSNGTTVDAWGNRVETDTNGVATKFVLDGWNPAKSGRWFARVRFPLTPTLSPRVPGEREP
jgi:YD repeat-containing protein